MDEWMIPVIAKNKPAAPGANKNVFSSYIYMYLFLFLKKNILQKNAKKTHEFTYH